MNPDITTPNPFATTYTRPEALEFLVDRSDFPQSVVESFRENNFLGQIVGPHGCGKTTLTFALEKTLTPEFELVRRVTIRSSRDVFSSASDFDRSSVDRANINQLLIVDGFERLPWLHQRMLIKNCRDNKYGLIITTHQRVRGVPVICELKPELKTLSRLVERLAPDFHADPSMLESIFQRNQGNIRESLMAMYDWFERDQPPT